MQGISSYYYLKYYKYCIFPYKTVYQVILNLAYASIKNTVFKIYTYLYYFLLKCIFIKFKCALVKGKLLNFISRENINYNIHFQYFEEKCVTFYAKIFIKMSIGFFNVRELTEDWLLSPFDKLSGRFNLM